MPLCLLLVPLQNYHKTKVNRDCTNLRVLILTFKSPGSPSILGSPSAMNFCVWPFFIPGSISTSSTLSSLTNLQNQENKPRFLSGKKAKILYNVSMKFFHITQVVEHLLEIRTVVAYSFFKHLESTWTHWLSAHFTSTIALSGATSWLGNCFVSHKLKSKQ